jgi:hypothetical protein
MRTLAGSCLLTAHAETRARQRGLRLQAIELVLGLHDQARHVGNGQEAWSVSRERCRALRDAGFTTALVERLARTILVVEPLTRTVLTAISGHADSHHRYRRGEEGRPRRAWTRAAAAA